MENIPIPNKETIDNLTTYEEGADFIMEDLKLPMDSINNLNDVKEFLTCKYLDDCTDCTDIDQDYAEYLKDFDIMRKSLIQLEDEVETFLLSDVFKQELEEDFETSLNIKLCLDKLTSYRESLKNYECPIMVIGESKSGKSSFINLFLGDIVLPVDNLTCTKIICNLRYGKEKKVVFSQSKIYQETFRESIKQNGDMEINLDTLSQFKKRELYGLISMNKGRNQFYDQSSFYWSLGFLKEHTVMIDSPGLCDSDELNEKTLECFDKKAAAYIFVFNATRENRWVRAAEGFNIPSWRLLLIDRLWVSAGYTWRSKVDNFVREAFRKLSSPDRMTKETEKVIFVINQWDLISDLHPEEEEEKQNSVLDKLKSLWPGLDPHDKVFFISSKKTLDWLKQKAIPESFRRLNYSLQKLIKKAHKSSTDANYGLVKMILEKVDKRVLENIKATHDRHFKSSNYRQEKQTRTEKLNDAFNMAEEVKRDLIKETKVNFVDAAKKFILYIQSEEVSAKLLDVDKLPILQPYNNIKIITPLIKKIIRHKMEHAIISWDKETKYLSNLYVTFKLSLDRKLNNLGNALTAIDTGLKKDFMDFNNHDKDTDLLNQGVMEVISPFEKAVLITSSFVLFPVMAIGAMVAAPNFIISLVKDKIDERALLDDFRSNHYKCTQSEFQTYLKKLKPKDIFDTFFDHMLVKFNLAAESIPERIKALIRTENRKLKLCDDESRTTNQLLQVYRPLQQVTNHLNSFLSLIDFRHHPDDQYESSDVEIDYPLDEELLLLTTSYAKYYRSPLSGEVYRLLKQPLSMENAKEQYDELNVFKLLKYSIEHKENVLEWKSYKRIKDHRVLVHIMETFDMSLRQYLEEHPNCIAAKQVDMEMKRKAFDFCLDIAAQTAQVLNDVEISCGLVHKDLRAENILVKLNEDDSVTVKLCDFSSMKRIDDAIRNDPKAMRFLPPEMKLHLGGFEMSEVYCFGGFLWEIYTMGSDVVDEIKISGSLNDCEALRFDLKDANAPSSWQKLIDSCMEVNPIKRPSMKTCYESIKQLKEELAQPNWREMFQETHEKKAIVMEKYLIKSLPFELYN